MLRKLLLLSMLVFGGGTLIMVGWYQIDGIPIAETEDYMSGSGYVTRENPGGSIVFTPDTPNGAGIVIMHGALIKPKSYAKSAAYFAQLGYTVYLPYGPGRMSIAAIETTAAALDSFDMDQWFFIGHSMGGMASLETITVHGAPAAGVALWATSMPKDFSAADLPILFIWGDTDGLLPAERFAAAQKFLPDDVRYITLEGANHKNFALYGHQFFDSDATIDWMEQIDFANETTAAFFAEITSQ